MKGGVTDKKRDRFTTISFFGRDSRTRTYDLSHVKRAL